MTDSTKTMHFRTIWPERRVVDEALVRSWFRDALVGARLDLDLASEAARHDDVDAMARVLDDAGLVTFTA
jgi:hypothetical protein